MGARALSQQFSGKCGVCGSVGPYSSPLVRMCFKCHRLYSAAASPVVELSGHPANSTYYRSEDKDAIKKWFAHLRRHGFVQKRGRWVRREKEEGSVKTSVAAVRGAATAIRRTRMNR